MAQSVKPSTKPDPGAGFKSVTQSSLQAEDLSSSLPPIEVFPEEIVFKDIETEQTYEVTVCVRNLSPHVRRIRFAPPRTSKFTAQFETLGALAVGIATNVVVTFESDQLGDFHDEMHIHCEGFDFTLPLHAFKPKPEIRFDPFVNLGFTAVGRPATGVITFQNEGSMPGDVRLIFDKQSASELTVVPEIFHLDPKASLSVGLSYVSREVNTFRCLLEVMTEGQDVVRHIDVNANCVEQQLALVATSLEKVGEADVGLNHMAMTTSLDFKTMYHGQKKEIEAFLVNVGPFPVRYQIKFVQGSEEEAESEGYVLMTPQELANQSIKRVIDASPLSGEVPAFAQIPIQFTCNSKRREASKGFAHNMMEENHSGSDANLSNSLENVVDYFYSALFEFGESEQRLTVHIQARAVLPNVKISHTSVHFYECPVNEQRDFLIKIENQNEELPLSFDFSMVAHFSMNPNHGILLPLQTKVVVITFKPGNLGVFESQSTLSFLKGAYNLQLTLYGQSSTTAGKQKQIRGTESLRKDFNPQRKFVSEEEIAKSTQIQPKNWLQASLPDMLLSTPESQQQQSNQKYNEFLKESRRQRLSAMKQKRIAAKSQTVSLAFEDIEKNTDFLLSTGPIRTKQLQLPPAENQLYVEKQMGKDNHDPDKPMKNVVKRPIDRNRFEEVPFSIQPTKQLEVKECAYSLTPFDMNLISAGPKELNYDKMVISSETWKWFSVVNDLKQHIFVELIPSAEEVHRIDPPSLVIPPRQKGGFKVVLMSLKKQRIVSTIKYVINGKYGFNFRVVGEVEPAVLELALPDPAASNPSPLFLNFKFDDESLEESLNRPILILNKCSAQTRFSWVIPPDCNFSVEPPEELVDAMKQRTVLVKFTPGQGKNNEETLIMRVDNGESQALNCRGEVNAAECFFAQKSVDFGMTAVGVKVEKPVTLRNNKPKYAVFHVKKCPLQLEVSPMRGRIAGDGKLAIKVFFLSLKEEEVSEEIEVSIRGGKILRIQIHARAIIPQIYIQEPDIDFGGVTVGSQLQRRFTLVNESPIPTVLYLNLEDHPEFDISVPPGDTDNESAVLVPATTDKDSPFYLKEEEEDLDDPKPDPMMNEDETESEAQEEENHRKFKITVGANKNVVLQLRFSPKETEPYQFTIPFLLAGINQTVTGLQRTVNGEGLKPRFYVEKSIIDFEKKVISLQEKSFPTFRHPLISNPEVYPVKWRVDCTDIDKTQIFAIKPSEGILESGNFSHMHISFNPTQPTTYEEHVGLYLDGSKDPYMSLCLMGEGTVPRISFDRREVILPVVPLNIPAKCVFYIINDGYENVELDCKVNQDAVKIDLKLNFPGGKQLGVGKQRLTVEVVFISAKPLSFTSRVDFIDNDGKRYPIMISGTADNSLLSAYPFIQRNADEVKFIVGETGLVTLTQDAQSDTEVYSDKGGKSAVGQRTSAASSVVSRSARSIIGYNPVPQALLERSLEFLTRWLNHSILSTPISKLPDDFIEGNGVQIYELINVVAGKMPPGQAKLQNAQPREMTRLLTRQYEELLKWLKSNGALLNTIRPEYLLSMADFGRYLKATPDQLQLKARQVERRWPYLSMDSWVTLLYQIIRVFGLGHITPKVFKSLPGMPTDKATIEESMTGSNIYSLPENILLKWLSYHFTNAYPMTSRKVHNFDQDLLDGTVFAAVIQSHIGGAIGQLAKVKFNALTEEQKKQNIDRVIASLNENGMPTFLTPKDLNPSLVSPRELLIFCLTLFHGLPHYIPKSEIEFPCVLGERVTKNLELTNPSNKQITYWVKLDDDTDFKLEHEDEFSIAPRSTESFPIHFQSRLFKSITAKLRFTSRANENSARAAALVFRLVSKVYSRKSEKVVETEANLYEITTKEVEVTNFFPSDAEFLVQIQYPEPDLLLTNNTKKSLQQKTSSKRSVETVVVFPRPFYIKNDRVKVKKGATNLLSVQFLPFQMESQEANLIFIDEKVGEMMYTIVGTVLPPRADKQDKFELKREMGNLAPVEVSIFGHNRMFDAAKREALNRFQSAAKSKEREALKEVFKGLQEDSSVFDVTINSPFFTGPTVFAISDLGRGKKIAVNLDTSQLSNLDQSQHAEEATPTGTRPKEKEKEKPKKRTNLSRSSVSVATTGERADILALGFTPRQPGDYPCQITMMNKLKTDIRVLEVLVSVKPKKAKITLEMTTQARGEVSQEIPVTNTGDKDWNVKTRLTQEGELFSVSKDFQVRKKTTGQCIVKFKPEWVCESTAKLEMDIVTSGEVYEFELFGKCEEPLAEDNIIIPCRVKERSTHFIPVPNPKNQPVTYRVVSDLSNATGDALLEVPGNSSKDYELVMYPLQSGVYTGSITFIDPQSRFYWYTLEVQSATPEPEAVKELRVQCRKAVEFKITVFNPLREDTTFDVNVLGEGLFGESQFTVSALDTGIYQLLYSPLLPAQGDGAVSFMSEKTGEFWYKLKLVCEPATPVEKEMFECGLGKSLAKPVLLENPSNKEVILEYACSNTLNYELIPDQIILPAYGSVEALIRYTPTSLKFIEKAEIRLTSKTIGDWVFLLKGKGTPPSEMEPIIVTAGISESNSVQIPFKNPFRDGISVSITLETEHPETFQLLLRRAKFSVGPMGILMVPVAFKPENMEELFALVVVSASDELTWRFPLRGITERPSLKTDFVFRTKCRSSLERQIDVQLSDLPKLPEEENFTHELHVVNPELSTLVFRSFHIEPIKSILQDPSECLKFRVRFEPLRPFKTDAELFIYKSSGGRWRFNVLIEAKDPDVDDTIVIEAPMGRVTSVAFKLANHFKQYASFDAYFSAESDPCFTVSPTTGTLEPYGREGSLFKVTFTPSEYGAPKNGKLIVKTEDMQWSYMVKGTHPHYRPPEVPGGRLDNKLSKHLRDMVDTAQHVSKKNYIRDNIRTQKGSPKRSVQTLSFQQEPL